MEEADRIAIPVFSTFFPTIYYFADDDAGTHHRTVTVADRSCDVILATHATRHVATTITVTYTRAITVADRSCDVILPTHATRDVAATLGRTTSGDK